MPAARETANVLTKSVYEPAAPADGRRVLVTQYWPRGVPKAAADEYVRALAPSRELLYAFKQGEIDWDTFRRRYREEMRTPAAMSEVRRLAEDAAHGPITLMCACRDEARCHRSLLRALITGEQKE